MMAHRIILWLTVLLSGHAIFALPLEESKQQICSDLNLACENIESAHLCGKTKVCIKEQWEKLNLPNDNNEVCDICKEMVKEARDQLESNETQEELKEVFEGSCALIPIKIIADECKKLADQFIPELVDMLASRMDPNQVCTVAGLCNSAKVHQMTTANNGKLKGCTHCLKFSNFLKKFLKVVPKEKIVDESCKEKSPGKVQRECKFFVDTSITQLGAHVKKLESGAFCGKMGKCLLRREPVNTGEDVLCEFCTSVLQHYKDEITSNTTRDELKTALENFCSQLGGFAQECKDYVDDYFDEVFDFFVKEMDPKLVCTALGLCKGSKVPFMQILPANKKLVPMMKLTPAKKVVPLVKIYAPKATSKVNVYEKTDRFIHPVMSFQRDVDCAICKAVMYFAEKEAKLPTDPVQVKAKLLQMCNVWQDDKEVQRECKEFVETFGDKIGKFISQGMKPEATCRVLKLCPAIKTVTLKNDLECDLCEQLITMVEKQLGGQATEESIENALKEVCSLLPQSIETQCDDFVHQYTPLIISLLLEELDPDTVCQALGVCPQAGLLEQTALPKDPQCDLCKQIANILLDELKDNKTEEAIKNALDKVCSLLPSKYSQECQQLIDQNLEMLLKVLTQELTADQLCQMLGACSSSELPKDPQCDLCKEIANILLNELKDDKTEAAIKTALDKVCSLLPSKYSQECQKFVNQNLDMLLHLLTQEITADQLCQMLGECKSSDLPKDPECELCKEMANILLNELKDDKTEEAIKTALDKVCSLLPSKYSQGCQKLIDQNIDMLLHLLAQEITADELCQTLGVCSSSSVTSVFPKDPKCDMCKQVANILLTELKDDKTEAAIKSALDKVCTLLPSKYSQECQNFVNQNLDMLLHLLTQEFTADQLCQMLGACSSSELPKDPQCDLCKEIANILLNELKDDKTEEAIKTALDKVCTLLPSKYSQECQNFVDQNLKMLMKLLSEEITADELCKLLGVCTSTVATSVKVNSVECIICKEVTEKLQGLLKDNKTEESIKHAVEYVCHLFPSSKQEKCKSFIDQYTDVLVFLLSSEVKSDVICATLGLCSPVEQVECELCQYVLHYLQNELMDNSTEEEIKEKVEKVCSILPSSLSTNCKAFIDEYGDGLIVLLAQKLDPSVICTMLGVCTSAKYHRIPIKHVRFDTCDSCVLVVDYVDKLLKDDDVEKEIDNIIAKVCPALPQSAVQDCESIIQLYGPYILQMIGQLADSKQVCQEIRLCPKTVGHVQLLGGKKCSSGPGYWCLSMQHANACNTSSFCQKKVWKTGVPPSS